MYSAAVKNITLLGGFVKYRVEPEALRPRLQAEHRVLIVRHADYVLVATAILVDHHRTNAQSHLHSLTSYI
jgi:hypothetical protein